MNKKMILHVDVGAANNEFHNEGPDKQVFLLFEPEEDAYKRLVEKYKEQKNVYVVPYELCKEILESCI